MIITRRCFLCGALTSVVCDAKAWEAYQNGALAQDVFPEMDLRSRETLISGMCTNCQKDFFEMDDEE